MDEHSDAVIGLLILHSQLGQDGATTLHIGYLLGEASWGQGYASELIKGLVNAVKTRRSTILLGGVAKENGASARILERLGLKFERTYRILPLMFSASNKGRR
jgi:ribosomal-protein-alanine N-acetyltransferase